MRFVVDAQLPPGLAAWLQTRGHEAWAVRDLGLRDADDGAVWAHAVSLGAAIITKDRDFMVRRNASSAGPQIVWLAVGNTVNRALLVKLAGAWTEIEARLKSGHRVVEMR